MASWVPVHYSFNLTGPFRAAVARLSDLRTPSGPRTTGWQPLCQSPKLPFIDICDGDAGPLWVGPLSPPSWQRVRLPVQSPSCWEGEACGWRLRQQAGVTGGFTHPQLGHMDSLFLNMYLG